MFLEIFSRYFIITTHVAQLLQLSELLCAQLQIFAPGAAQKSPKLHITRFALKNNLKTFFRHFLIRTRAVQLLQLSERFCALLHIFASGTAQKSPNSDILWMHLKNIFKNLFLDILWSECILHSFCSYQNCSVLYFNFRFWSSAKVAKTRLSEKWCRKWFQEIFSIILRSEHLLCSFHNYRNLSVHNFKFSLSMRFF